MTSRNNVSRVTTEDIEGFGARGCPWLNCVVSCFVQALCEYGVMRYFLRNMFSTPLPGDREMCDRFY